MSRRTNSETPGLLHDLLKRIHREHRNHEQLERSRHFKQTLPYLLVCALGAFYMQYHIQIYNVIVGPFHLNHAQLVAHMKIYNQEPSSSRTGWFSLPKEYLQIEIGENHIERHTPCAHRLFHDQPRKGIITASIHQVKETTISDSSSSARFFITVRRDTKPQTYPPSLLLPSVHHSHTALCRATTGRETDGLYQLAGEVTVRAIG
jgi:hypothetical protein